MIKLKSGEIIEMSNVDIAEIAKFSAQQQSWWDIDGPLKTLHDINPLRISWINSLVKLRDLTVLDVGCGGGILTESLAVSGAKQVLGVDLAQGALAAAQLHAQQRQFKNISYQQIAVEDLAQQQPNSYDVVCCLEMLEHVPEPQSIIQACAKLVKDGGWVFFSTINRNLKAKLLVVYAAEYILNMIPKGTHQFDKFIQPHELAQMCRQAGLTVRQLTGLSYAVLGDYYELSEDVSMNYFLALQK